MGNGDELVGRLVFEQVRKAFKNEARHFTTWLEDHLDVLADRLGIKLSVVQREKAVGDFNVDLLCEDHDGHAVIIENQLERTDHNHLGQLLTYLVNLDAKTAIWITPEPRPEHIRVIEWLNESTPADLSFYLVKVEAARIGTSPIAPLFNVLTAPDAQTKEIGEKKKDWAERHVRHNEFWTSLLEKMKVRNNLFSSISPGRDHWIATGAGRSGVSFNFTILTDKGGSELYIDSGFVEQNKAIFDALFDQKEEVEKQFGEPLEWQRLDNKRASRIRKRFDNGGLDYPETWSHLQDLMIDAMIRLDKVFRPRLARITL